MIFNWLDIILIVILIITFVLGIIKGLVRQIIGILTVIIGLVLAVNYYSYASTIFSTFISNEVLSHLLGFLLIFFAILCLGCVISWAFSKMMKGSLKFLNHILGGVLGLIKGILICGIIVFALLVFPVNARVLKECQLAPYCLRITKAVYYLIPQELKEKFSDAYRDIVERKGRDAERI